MYFIGMVKKRGGGGDGMATFCLFDQKGPKDYAIHVVPNAR